VCVPYISHSFNPGRNGGHLTPNPFIGFRAHSARYGTNEALKSLAIEQYTASQILKILDSEKLSDAVDLVEGGRTCLIFTEQSGKDWEADFEAARAAGVDLSKIEWINKKTMEEVRRFMLSSYRYK